MMKVSILGTGTSQGIPVVACPCRVCTSTDPADHRLRTSVMVRSAGTQVVIDAGPDFRQQMLRHEVKQLDAVLITHGHKDHTGGLDDVRAFNWFQKKSMPIYAKPAVLGELKQQYPYAFGLDKYPGAPELVLEPIGVQPFRIGQMHFTPIEAMHRDMPVTGFRLGGFSYLTDANHISREEMQKMYGSDVIVINALRKERHHSHFNLGEAVQLLEQLKPARGFITHISHQMGLHREVEATLPEFIRLATDNLVLEVPDPD